MTHASGRRTNRSSAVVLDDADVRSDIGAAEPVPRSEASYTARRPASLSTRYASLMSAIESSRTEGPGRQPVGMLLAGESAVGLTDLVLRRLPRHPEGVVVVDAAHDARLLPSALIGESCDIAARRAEPTVVEHRGAQ